MLTRRNLMLFAAISSLALASPALADDLPNLARVKVDLVAPPLVHPHEQATKQAPRVVQFKMNIQEKEVQIDDEGTKIHAMTFNGSIPGPMMVVHEGDYVELTLVNPSTNMMAHNIDFHSATGALGGAELTLVNPGEQVTLRWKATRQGVFVYHCAPGGPMSGSNGANGTGGGSPGLFGSGMTRHEELEAIDAELQWQKEPARHELLVRRRKELAR